ncbi:MAG: GldM family protein [Bacteroidota bacterium]
MTLSKVLAILVSFMPLFIGNANAQTIAIENARATFAYPEIDNSLSIIVETYPCSSIYVSTNNGEIERLNYDNNPCLFNFRPSEIGIANLKIYQVSGKDTLQLGERIIRVKKWPNQTARVGGQSSGSMSRAKFLAQGGVQVRINLNDINGHIKVKSFNVEVFRKGSSIFDFHNKGARFESLLREKLKTLLPGDSISITKINIIMPGESQPTFANEINLEIE